jgi:hypothetical protein
MILGHDGVEITWEMILPDNGIEITSKTHFKQSMLTMV